MPRLALVCLLLVTVAACDTTEPDLESPRVQITSPAVGVLLSGTVEVAYTTTEPAEATLLVDGTPAATSSDGTFDLDTAGLADAEHRLVVNATDEAGNLGTSAARSVRVYNNPLPTVTILDLPAGSIVRGTTTVRYSVVSLSDIASATLLVEGVEVAQGTSGTLQFDTRAYEDGTYDLAVRVEDAEGDVTTETVSVEFQNDAQSVGLTSLTLIGAPFTRPTGAPWDIGFMEAPDFHLSLRYPGGEVIWSDTAVNVQPSDLPITEDDGTVISLPIGGEVFAKLYEVDDFDTLPVANEVASESQRIVLDQVRERPSTIRLTSADGRFVAEFDLVWSFDPPSLPRPGALAVVPSER